jgi:hypothetical protein
MTLIVNLYGGPGTGKSTTAAALFAELKQAGVNSELVTEYAKDRVWDEHHACLGDQIYLFGKQYHRIYRLLNKVQVIVTDAPLLLSAYYGAKNTPASFTQLVLDTHRGLNTFDVFLRRVKAYNPSGRMQTEQEAKGIDVELKELLDKFGIVYADVTADQDAAKVLAKSVLRQITPGGEFPPPITAKDLSREEVSRLAAQRPYLEFINYPLNLDGAPSLEAVQTVIGGREL